MFGQRGFVVLRCREDEVRVVCRSDKAFDIFIGLQNSKIFRMRNVKNIVDVKTDYNSRILQFLEKRLPPRTPQNEPIERNLSP